MANLKLFFSVNNRTTKNSFVSRTRKIRKDTVDLNDIINKIDLPDRTQYSSTAEYSLFKCTENIHFPKFIC